MARVKIKSVPKMQTGGSAMGSHSSPYTQDNYAEKLRNTSNPAYQEYKSPGTPSMYKVDNWSGLYYDMSNPNAGWEGFGKDENLLSNQKRTDSYTGPVAGGVATTGSNNYSIDKTREEEGLAKYGGSIKKKIRITGTPTNTPIDNYRMSDNTMMATGGYANQGPTRKYGDQQKGQGYALDRFWSSPAGYPGSTSQVNPYGVTGNKLPEAKDGGDINAEKQEMVLGDFDQDGQQELMNVNGKPHTEGGKDINVPSNSFVFSDTKALKIKDPLILAMFNMSAKKGGYTPAEIAKKYDLNKLKKILDDPKADEFAKKTAQLMYDNYLAKLNKLATIQEGIKKQMGMDHHDPNAQQGQQQEPEVQEAGNMAPGGQDMMQPEVMAQYGGEIPQYQNAGVYPNDDLKNKVLNNTATINEIKEYNNKYKSLVDEDYGVDYNSNTIANQQVAQSVPAPYIMQSGQKYNTPLSIQNKSFFERLKKENPYMFEQDYGQGRSMANLQGKGIDELYGPGYENVRAHAANYNLSALPISPYMPSAYSPDEAAGLELQPTYTPEPGTIPLKQVPEMPPIVYRKNEKTSKKKGEGWRAPQLNPNFYGDAMNAVQMANLRKFVPYESVPQAYTPETVFADYTAQAAAAQEAARSAGEGDTGATGRAMSLARQGESFKPVREAIASTQTQNVGIANAANAQAAQITNQLMSQQASRLAELNKAGFLADRDYQREMGRLQAEYADRMQKHHDTAVKTAWLNKTSPYFDVDPYTQMPVFKSEAAKTAYYKDLNGAPDSSLPSRVKQLQSEFPGASLSDLIDLAGGGAGKTRTQYGPTGTVQKTTVTSNQMQYGGNHMAMPEMAPRYQRNAEKIPHYDFGGGYLAATPGPDLPLAPIDKLGYQQPMQVPQENITLPKGNPLAGMSSKKMNKLDIATRTNNPGNMKYSSWMKNYGATPSGIPGKDGGEFAEFPDLNAGLQAYKTQIFGDTDGVFESNYYKADTPVDTALKTWSNKGYGAEIYPEISGKKLGELTPAQRNELIKRQIKRESGSMYKLLTQRGVLKYGGFALQKFIK